MGLNTIHLNLKGQSGPLLDSSSKTLSWKRQLFEYLNVVVRWICSWWMLMQPFNVMKKSMFCHLFFLQLFLNKTQESLLLHVVFLTKSKNM